MNPSLDKKKVALITGSGKRRIGRVVAEELANRGYQIALHYNRSAEAPTASVEMLRVHGVEARAFQADVGVEADVDRLFEEVLDHFGRLDVLVTSASVWESKSLEETTADDVRRQFDINTLGTFLCCRHAGLIMAKQPEGGTIVTVGDWAIERPYENYAAYFLSKGAIPTLTRTLAIELARRNPNIRVNCVMPGPVMPPADFEPGELPRVVAGTLLKRLGRPENVADAVAFLVENDYITGVCLPVDGGRTIAGYNEEARIQDVNE